MSILSTIRSVRTSTQAIRRSHSSRALTAAILAAATLTAACGMDANDATLLGTTSSALTGPADALTVVCNANGSIANPAGDMVFDASRFGPAGTRLEVVVSAIRNGGGANVAGFATNAGGGLIYNPGYSFFDQTLTIVDANLNFGLVIIEQVFTDFNKECSLGNSLCLYRKMTLANGGDFSFLIYQCKMNILKILHRFIDYFIGVHITDVISLMLK